MSAVAQAPFKEEAAVQVPLKEEIEVMQAVLDGYKDQTIARRHGISVITVRRRVSRYINHVGAKNRIQGAVVGVLEGWLTLEIAQKRLSVDCDSDSR